MMRVAFQGEPGAYSELAVQHQFPEALAVACRQFKHVIDAVTTDLVDAGVLPVENTLAGVVPGVAELLADERVRVEAEFSLPIHHCLMAVPGAMLATIRSVLSHPVALAQCTSFFARHPGLAAVEWFDTAGAGRHIAHTGDATLAAIASEAAANRYNLSILEKNLEDRADNQTRFVVIRRG
ncbi:MAG TPA: prephenate dehydratase domain-containing protein [Longimicrobiales bacterium]